MHPILAQGVVFSKYSQKNPNGGNLLQKASV
jgi:hypothetical protein